jgi:P-type E1-E2 ATPase
LKEQLAAKAWVKRGGSDWTEIAAEGLVPGDIIILRSGVVAPADCKIMDDVEVKVDQSVLTGMLCYAML